MEYDPIVLPIATIQHDFPVIISEVRDGLVPEDTFWLSCYKSGEESVHGKVLATLDDVDRDLVQFEGRDGVEMKWHGEMSYSAACSALNIPPTRIAISTRAFTDPVLSSPRRQSHKITALDVSPDGSQFATGYHDGSVHVRSSTAPSAPPSASCKPHVSTITSLRFFPSSRVLLTAGSDFALNILPADPPDPSAPIQTASPTSARTFRGHSRGITGTAIIARGRNILSAGKDGTLRLWDVPSGSQIRMMTAGAGSFSPIVGLSVGEGSLGPQVYGANGDISSPPADIDSREIETGDKLAFCALQDGRVEVFDLGAKVSVFRSANPGSPLEAISYAPTHGLLATGSVNGIVTVYDVRSLDTPLTCFRRNTASIEDLAFLTLSPSTFSLSASSVKQMDGESNDVGLAIATEDGLPYIAEVRPRGPSVRAELVGVDCDPARAVRAVNGGIWTAADDGVVRYYAG